MDEFDRDRKDKPQEREKDLRFRLSLGTVERKLLVALAASGDEFSLDELSDITSLDLAEIDAALSLLSIKGLISAEQKHGPEESFEDEDIFDETVVTELRDQARGALPDLGEAAIVEPSTEAAGERLREEPIAMSGEATPPAAGEESFPEEAPLPAQEEASPEDATAPAGENPVKEETPPTGGDLTLVEATENPAAPPSSSGKTDAPEDSSWFEVPELSPDLLSTEELPKPDEKTEPAPGPAPEDQPPSPSLFELMNQMSLEPDHLRACLERLGRAHYYEALGLDPAARRKEVRRAYFDLVGFYHPDQHRELEDPSVKQFLADIFSLLTRAYETLYGKKRRREYDRTIPQVTGVVESEEELALSQLFDEDPKAAAGSEKDDRPLGWSFYEAAREAFLAGDYHAADLNFKLAVGMEPKRKEYLEGLERTRKILSDRLLEDLKREGRRLEEARKFKEAVTALTRASEIAPEDHELYYDLARIRFLKTMDRKQAELDLARALELSPRHVESLLLLGRIQALKGDRESAVQTFKQVLAISPGLPKARQALELFEK